MFDLSGGDLPGSGAHGCIPEPADKRIFGLGKSRVSNWLRAEQLRPNDAP
jgi:hypothetical protein